MKLSIYRAGVAGMIFLGGSASAQIVSQTPQPDIPEASEEVVQILKPEGRIGRSGNTIKVARSGALLFAGFDTNSDYIIDTAEVTAGIDRAFDRADVDKNGSLSLVELEGWRLKALGSLDAAPNNYAFAPNFARSVSPQTFREVLEMVSATLDKDEQGEMDGKIPLSDLLANRRAPRAVKNDDAESCISRIQEERRRVEQQCRNNRGF